MVLNGSLNVELIDKAVFLQVFMTAITRSFFSVLEGWSGWLKAPLTSPPGSHLQGFPKLLKIFGLKQKVSPQSTDPVTLNSVYSKLQNVSNGFLDSRLGAIRSCLIEEKILHTGDKPSLDRCGQQHRYHSRVNPEYLKKKIF